MEFKPFVTNPYHASQWQSRRCSIFNDDVDESTIGRESQPNSPRLSTIERFLLEPTPTFVTPTLPRIDQNLMHPLPHAIERRYASPALSAIDSSYVSSGWSDRQATPLSPHLANSPYSPGYSYDEGIAYPYGGFQTFDRHDSLIDSDCVAMPDVQKYADNIPDTLASWDDGMHSYGWQSSWPQEGFQPLNPEEEEYTPATSYSVPSPQDQSMPETEAQEEPTAPAFRRRKTQPPPRQTTTSPRSEKSRVSKRPSAARRSSSHQSTSESKSARTDGRAFPCPLVIYGCQSSFGSKNEWKRHINTQHMCLSFWRCDQCTSPNDFNRKDLFIQHVRRMHPLNGETAKRRLSHPTKKSNGEDQLMQEIASRCCQSRREPPETSCCLFCPKTFSGKGAWDDRLEHIGQEMEAAKKSNDTRLADPKTWRRDQSTETYMVKEGIIVAQGGGWVLFQTA